MAKAIMGTKFKKVKVFIDKHGNVKKGSITENLEGHDLVRTADTNRLSKGAGKTEEATKQKADIQVKQCLGCSSLAAEGKDYCNSCFGLVGGAK